MMLYQVLIWSIIVVNVCSGWSWKCSFCWWASDAIIKYNRMGKSEQFALSVVSDACEVLRIYPRPVCQGMVTNVGARLFSILRLDPCRRARACVVRTPNRRCVVTTQEKCDPTFEDLSL